MSRSSYCLVLDANPLLSSSQTGALWCPSQKALCSALLRGREETRQLDYRQDSITMKGRRGFPGLTPACCSLLGHGKTGANLHRVPQDFACHNLCQPSQSPPSCNCNPLCFVIANHMWVTTAIFTPSVMWGPCRGWRQTPCTPGRMLQAG